MAEFKFLGKLVCVFVLLLLSYCKHVKSTMPKMLLKITQILISNSQDFLKQMGTCIGEYGSCLAMQERIEVQICKWQVVHPLNAMKIDL